MQHVGGEADAYRILVENLEGKKLLGRPRRRWEDNIKMVHREMRWDGVDWINLNQDRYKLRALVTKVITLQAPYNFGKFVSG
jgi:hypothetical protein